ARDRPDVPRRRARRAGARPRTRDSAPEGELFFSGRRSTMRRETTGGSSSRRKDNDTNVPVLETRSDCGDQRLPAPDVLARLALTASVLPDPIALRLRAAPRVRACPDGPAVRHRD